MELLIANSAYVHSAVEYGFHLLDVNGDTGIPIFRPSQELWVAFNNKEMEPREYGEQYLYALKMHYQANPEVWKRLLQLDKTCLAHCRGTGTWTTRRLFRDFLGVIAPRERLYFKDLGDFVPP